VSNFYVLPAEWDYIITGSATRAQLRTLGKTLEKALKEGDNISHPTEDFFSSIIAAIWHRFEGEGKHHYKTEYEVAAEDTVDVPETKAYVHTGPDLPVKFKGQTLAERRQEAQGKMGGREGRDKRREA
jgi:hypothetical protein